MEKDIVKQIQLAKHLDKMMEIDMVLYERILDTPGFAFHFNQICLMAECGHKFINSETPSTEKSE